MLERGSRQFIEGTDSTEGIVQIYGINHLGHLNLNFKFHRDCNSFGRSMGFSRLLQRGIEGTESTEGMVQISGINQLGIISLSMRFHKNPS